MQPRVLQGDRQAQPRAAGGTRACRVGPPEAAEDPGGLARLEPDAVVAHRDGDRAPGGGEFDDDVTALAVLNGVDDEVAQHAFHPPGVRLGDDGLLVAGEAYLRSLALGERLRTGDDPAHDLPEVYRLGLQRGGARVEAADLQQVREQRLEPVQLVGEQFGRPRGHRIEVHTCVVDDVGRHPHRGQRRAQFVRHVGDEPPLHPRQVLQLTDLELEVLRHLVEGLAQPGDVVLAGDLHPFLQPPRGQPLGDARRHPHGCDDLAHHEPGDGTEQHHDEEAGGRQGAPDQAERLLLLGQREEVVELVGLAVRVVDLLADDQAGLGRLVGVVDDPGVALCGRGVAVDALAQGLGHAGRPVDHAGGAWAASAAALPAHGEGDHVERALTAAGERLHQLAHPLDDVLRGTTVRGGGVVAVGARRLLGLLLGRRETAGGLALGGLHLGVEQTVADLPDHHEAEEQHHAQRHQQSGGDDLELDVAPPQPYHRQQGAAHPAHEQTQHRTALHPAVQQPALQDAAEARAGGLAAGGSGADRPPGAGPGPGRRSGTVPGHVSSVRPCNRRRGRSPRSPASPGPSRPWSAAAGRAR